MIHGATNHPVLIKKIKLKIWKLRDELEAVVKARWQNSQKSQESHKLELSDLAEEYAPKSLVHEQTETDTPSSEEEEKESEAAHLEAVPDEQDEQQEEVPTEQQADNVKIFTRRPELEADKVHGGEVILAEVDMKGINFFSDHKFIAGQSIVIEFLVPKKFIMNADVTYCRNINLRSRIISEQRHPYRVCASFTFLRPGERTLLRQFVQSIEPEVAKKALPPAQKITATSDDGDDFDDLDDFDL